MQGSPNRTAQAHETDPTQSDTERMSQESAHELAALVRAERVRMVFAQSAVLMFASPLAGGVLVWALWDAVPHLSLCLWLAGLAVLAGVRYTLVRAFLRQHAGGVNVGGWERAFVATVVSVALWWGVGAMVLLVGTTTETGAASEEIFVFAFLMLMASASSAAYAAHPLTVTLTTLALGGPITLYFAAQDSVVHRALALGSLLYVTASYLSIRALGDFFSRTQRLAHELKQERNRAEHLARTDHLTALNNRRAFCELSEAAIRHAERYGHPAALIMLDLDHFKAINDEFGHVVGDEVLRALASLIKHHFRSTDIACRFGGEEFAIFLPETGLENALSTGERLRSLIESHPLSANGKPLRFTASIGVGQFEPGFSLEQLIASADSALYEAKRRGRNSVVPASGRRQSGETASLRASDETASLQASGETTSLPLSTEAT